MTPQPSRWSQALDSLVDPSSYARVARQPFKRTIAYVAWLIAVAALIGAVLTQVQLVRWARTEGPVWLRRLPPFAIAEGRVNSPVKQPWVYEMAGGQSVLVLDTTGKTTAIDERYPQGVLLTERALITKRGPRLTETTDLSRVRSFAFNEEIGRRWLRSLQWFCIPLVWTATTLYLAIAKPLQIVAFSLWSLLLNGMLGRGWSYRALWTMGAYALTGPMLLNLLMTTVTPALPVGVGGLIVTAVYLVYLTLAVAQPAASPPPQEIKLA